MTKTYGGVRKRYMPNQKKKKKRKEEKKKSKRKRKEKKRDAFRVELLMRQGPPSQTLAQFGLPLRLLPRHQFFFVSYMC